MKRLSSSVVILIAGLLLGWWLRGLFAPEAGVGNQVSASQLSRGLEARREVAAPAAASTSSPRVVHRVAPDVGAATLADPTDTLQKLRKLLAQQDFDQAMALYEEALLEDDDYQLLLRPVIQNYLQACLEQCAPGVFITLVDSWLASYYEDIPVLLLLADYQRRQGYPEEAVRVLQMAMTYAYQPNQQESVSRALSQVVQATDDYYSAQQRWVELLGFYELLEAIALGEPAFALRQASLYHRLGESERARDLLLALRESDDGYDPQWTQALNQQLATVAPAPEAARQPANAIPVTRRGDHYLVQAALNGRQKVVLMIDTGASVTSLSRASFERLDGDRFYPQGSRMFNTANGLAKGQMFRADSISLGSTRVDAIDIAVLDYDSSRGVDGLLGMNVLRNYRFEIDQDRELLYLRPR